MNAKTAKKLRKIARVMANVKTGYSPYVFGTSVAPARHVPGSYKDCYRSLKKASDPIGILHKELEARNATQ